MTETTKKTPWHIWVVGIVTLLWNAIGAMDYVMTQLRVESYMSQFTEEQLAFFYGFPGWVNASWAIAVWGAILGSILILLRSKLAVPVFWIGLVAMVATAIHNVVLSEVSMTEIAGTGAMWFSLVIFVVAVLLVIYATVQKRNGNLR